MTANATIMFLVGFAFVPIIGPPYHTSCDPPSSINSRRSVPLPPVGLDSSRQTSLEPPAHHRFIEPITGRGKLPASPKIPQAPARSVPLPMPNPRLDPLLSSPALLGQKGQVLDLASAAERSEPEP